MKNYFLNFKQIFVLCLLLAGSNLNAQTSWEARMFFNRTNVAIAKIEKEMFYSKDITYTAEIKKAIKYQVISLNLFNQNNFKDAVGYSYKARTQCIELCTKMAISEGSYYALNDEEKGYCKPANYTNLALKPSLLNPAQTKKIEDLDILNVQQFRDIDLNLK